MDIRNDDVSPTKRGNDNEHDDGDQNVDDAEKASIKQDDDQEDAKQDDSEEAYF